LPEPRRSDLHRWVLICVSHFGCAADRKYGPADGFLAGAMRKTCTFLQDVLRADYAPTSARSIVR